MVGPARSVQHVGSMRTAALLLVLAACTDYKESHYVSVETDARRIAPGVGIAVNAHWYETEIKDPHCVFCEDPNGQADSNDLLREVLWSCEGQACDLHDHSGTLCHHLEAQGSALHCDNPSIVSGAAEGPLDLEVDMVSTDGDGFHTRLSLELVAPAALTLAPCGGKYPPDDCIYTDDQGVPGLAFRVDGLRDGAALVVDQQATATVGTVTCHRRECLWVAPAGATAPISATFGGLTISAPLTMPANLPSNPPRFP